MIRQIITHSTIPKTSDQITHPRMIALCAVQIPIDIRVSILRRMILSERNFPTYVFNVYKPFLATLDDFPDTTNTNHFDDQTSQRLSI